jgi:alpha-ketoglutarate-dependent taurine dioxygenase
VWQSLAFFCGFEFDSLSAELRFFGRHGLHLHEVEIAVGLQPGELLVFDNLAVAHGRRGTHQPGELRQRFFRHKLPPADQRKLRHGVLAAFYAGQPAEAPSSIASMP